MGPEVYDQGASKVFGFSWELSSWLADGHFLSYGLSSAPAQSSSTSPLVRTKIPSDESPTLMAKSNPSCLPKAPPPNIITFGERASTYVFEFDTIHSIKMCKHNLYTWFSFSLSSPVKHPREQKSVESICVVEFQKNNNKQNRKPKIH